jgi:Na+/glutamate symporter
MTEAELWQLQLLAVANTAEAVQGVVTIIFAYLVTAYFVGRRLTRFQTALVSLLFVLGATGASFMTFVEFRRAAMFMEQLTRQFGVESISPNAVVIPLYAALMALLIPASVFFMYQIRGNPEPGAGPETTDAGASSTPR